MKKIWVFILGIITGIILTILFAVVASSSNRGIEGLNMFEQPGDCLVKKSNLEVFQVLGPGLALAWIEGKYESAYLLSNNEGKLYYDTQTIKLPSGKCFKQLGTYQYQNKEGRLKTVPVVAIM